MVDVTINGKPYDAAIAHFSCGTIQIDDMRELAKLQLFRNLRSACFAGSNLDDAGLTHLTQVATLENLNLQETEISEAGLALLARLPKLQYLRLKGNDQLTNACVCHLARLTQLVDLAVQETSIDEDGLEALVGHACLENICVDPLFAKYTFDGLRALSRRMPGCAILAKGHGEFLDGSFDGEWRE